jgi:hypothetical protein
MRFKGHRHGLAAAASCLGNNLAQNARVRPVHAVKIPHAKQRRPKLRRNLIEFVKNLHSIGQWLVVVASKSVREGSH